MDFDTAELFLTPLERSESPQEALEEDSLWFCRYCNKVNSYGLVCKSCDEEVEE